jgi:mono/diheme cytochrome c family protein
MNKTLIVAAALFMTAVLTSAQMKPSRTVWDGVYTEAQADRGKELVVGHCGYCHGEDLKGGPGAPQLVGPEFMFGWINRTAGDFFEQVQMTMPLDAPGSMTPRQYADVVAAIFRANGFPAHAEGELTPQRAALDDILIVKR